MVFVPPCEVGDRADVEQLVEASESLAVELRSGGLDGLVALAVRIDERLVEVVSLFHLHEVAQLTEWRRLVLDPRRDVDVGDALGAPAVHLEEVVELGQPDRSIAAGLRQGVANLIGLVFEQVGDAQSLGLVGQVPHRPVGLHDLGVATLQHLGDVAGIDSIAGAQPVQLQVDGEERVHDLEVDLPGAVLEGARVREVLADLGQ